MCQWRHYSWSRHPLHLLVFGQHVICICMQIKCRTVYWYCLGLLHQSPIILQIRILMPLFRHSGNTLGKCAFTILIKVKMERPNKTVKWLEKKLGLLLGELEAQTIQSWQNQCATLNCQSEQGVQCFFVVHLNRFRLRPVNLVHAHIHTIQL